MTQGSGRGTSTGQEERPTCPHCYGSESIPKVISVMEARRFMRKSCEAFLALILNFKREQVNIKNIPVIKEFPNVFPEELLGVPPEREVDLSIEVVQGTTPISRAPYRMAPTELKELKTELKELKTQL